MKKKGFTLVELLMVLVILALILLIAIPIFLTHFNSGTRSANKFSMQLIEIAIRDYVDETGNTSGNLCALKEDYLTTASGECIRYEDGRVLNYRETTFSVIGGNVNITPVTFEGNDRCGC